MAARHPALAVVLLATSFSLGKCCAPLTNPITNGVSGRTMWSGTKRVKEPLLSASRAAFVAARPGDSWPALCERCAPVAGPPGAVACTLCNRRGWQPWVRVKRAHAYVRIWPESRGKACETRQRNAVSAAVDVNCVANCVPDCGYRELVGGGGAGVVRVLQAVRHQSV